MTQFRDMEKPVLIRKIIIAVVTVAILLGLGFGALKFYRHTMFQCDQTLQNVQQEQQQAAELVNSFDSIERGAKEFNLPLPDEKLGADLRSVQNYEVGECGILKKGDVEANAKVVTDSLADVTPRMTKLEEAMAPQFKEKAKTELDQLPTNEDTKQLKDQFESASSVDEFIQIAISAKQWRESLAQQQEQQENGEQGEGESTQSEGEAGSGSQNQGDQSPDGQQESNGQSSSGRQ